MSFLAVKAKGEMSKIYTSNLSHMFSVSADSVINQFYILILPLPLVSYMILGNDITSLSLPSAISKMRTMTILVSQGWWEDYIVPEKHWALGLQMRSLQVGEGTHLSLQGVHPILEGLGLGLTVAQAQAAALQLPLERAPLQLKLDAAALRGIQHLFQAPLVTLQLHFIGLHFADLLLWVGSQSPDVQPTPRFPHPLDPSEKAGSRLEAACVT